MKLYENQKFKFLHIEKSTMNTKLIKPGSIRSFQDSLQSSDLEVDADIDTFVPLSYLNKAIMIVGTKG